ncbi:MAG: hypothetical protein WDN27_06905 [Candidatus Saccharibacteria bacterium]
MRSAVLSAAGGGFRTSDPYIALHGEGPDYIEQLVTLADLQ